MKHSGDPWTASGMKVSNKQHEAPVRDFLEAIIDQPKAHAKFLNMLSMLEHMGSRKIMVSQMDRGDVLSQDTLQHLAEEARHAYFFKRHAERINGAPMDGWLDANTMTRVPALMYFGRMDAGISKRVGNDDAYGWVSLIIELRACWLYGIYNDVVERADFHLPLKGLLAEEDHHLAEMFEMCGENHDLLKELSAYETSLFEKLWSALEGEFSSTVDNREAA
ncbi:MAG: hypothetical protein GW778_01170 [Alphaproteobacteria bacterium]|nr:hypothetical protein [Alphaproteobacteria bacterium]